MTGETRTYTFFGHWENDRIVVTEYAEGVHEDDRPDTGEYDEGLWAASGTGATVAAAEADARSEYDEND